MDLNSDMGEGFGIYQLGDDQAMLDVVTSANIACGFHAGDPQTMIRTVRAAAERGVHVGAHVAYRDLIGFGRRNIDATPAEITADIIYQVGALAAVARSCGTRVRYVKPHGALYNTLATHRPTAEAVVAAVRGCDPGLPIVTLPGSVLIDVARDADLTVVTECFADRAYTPNGRLVPRHEPGAVITDDDTVVDRALRMAVDGTVEAVDGTSIDIRAATMCVHGDTPGAAHLARRIRDALDSAGVTVAPFTVPARSV